jgi:hypothetical protein
MKYGMVAQIRLNPEDCQSILDLMGVLGIDPYDGRSFAQCLSIAVTSMLGSYRRNGVLPEVDPFQYLNRLGPFLKARNNKTKHVMADRLYASGGRDVASVELPQVSNPKPFLPEYLENKAAVQGWTDAGPSTTAAVPLQMDEGTKELLAEEMAALYAKSNDNKGQLSAEDEARLKYLNGLLFS